MTVSQRGPGAGARSRAGSRAPGEERLHPTVGNAQGPFRAQRGRKRGVRGSWGAVGDTEPRRTARGSRSTPVGAHSEGETLPAAREHSGCIQRSLPEPDTQRTHGSGASHPRNAAATTLKHYLAQPQPSRTATLTIGNFMCTPTPAHTIAQAAFIAVFEVNTLQVNASSPLVTTIPVDKQARKQPQVLCLSGTALTESTEILASLVLVSA